MIHPRTKPCPQRPPPAAPARHNAVMLFSVNLALRFLLELAGVVAIAWWGFHAAHAPLGLALGIGAPLALILVWAMWIAPRAIHPQTPGVRLVAGTILLEVTAVSLALVGATLVAVVLGAAILVNAGLLAATGGGDPR